MREGRRYALGGGRDDDPRASYKTEAVVVSVFAAAVVGGLIGGVLGVAGTLGDVLLRPAETGGVERTQEGRARGWTEATLAEADAGR